MSTNSLFGTDAQPDIVPTSDEKTTALLSHILTFIAPFLAPLIIYLIKKDESQFVRRHAAESLNFQITIIIICIVLFITVIGILLLWLVGIFSLICVVIATIRASEGKLYKYPFSIKLVQ